MVYPKKLGHNQVQVLLKATDRLYDSDLSPGQQKILERLEEEGLVEAVGSLWTGRGRDYIYSLTAAGREVLEKA